MTIPEFENQIEEAKAEYFKELQATQSFLLQEQSSDAVVLRITALHNKGVNFFNLFERSIDEYGLEFYSLNEDTKNRKVEDAQAIVGTIITHWQMVRTMASKFNVTGPKPSPLAYSSIQRLLKYFLPKDVPQLKEKFMASNLPTNGFDSKQKFSGWEIGSSKLTITQIVIGLVFVVVTGYLSYNHQTLNGMQYFFTRLILALGVVLIGSATLEGTMNLNWTISKSLTIKAVGWIAVFILLFYWNPPAAPSGVDAPPKEDIITTP